MAISISTALRNSILECMVNGGTSINFNSGTLKIYSGTAPSVDAAAPASGDSVLVTITLPADAFGAASSGSAAKAGTWEDTSADNTGTAAYFRILQSGDSDGATGSSDERIQGSVTATGGGGDLTLDSTSISSGQTVTVTSFSITMPAS